MACSKTHSHSNHALGPNCGHTAIRHDGHVDYLVDGTLHHPHGDHCDEHVIGLSDTNPDGCHPVMDRVVDMRQYNMAIMWITLSMVGFTINTAITVTITDRLSWFMRNISE